jgi:putative MATE family efflux protein
MASIFNEIIESIKGAEQDFTRMKLRRAVILLAIPMVMEMIMESLFALFDIIFVSKLGAEATAAVGITESLMTIIYSVGMGLAMAATGIVSRRIGEKKKKEASGSAFQSIFLGLLVSVPFFVLGSFFSKDILKLMGASQGVISNGFAYTSIMLGSNVIIILLFINNAIFRSAGDAMISMLVMIFANLINIVLDPCLIFGIGPFPEMGVTGAGIATCTGRTLGVLVQFYMFSRKNRKIYIDRHSIGIDCKIIKKLLKLSMGGIGQFLIATTSWVGLYRIMTEFGDNVVAGYTVAIRIVIFSLLPALGLSNAASTLVGQNLGAKKPERAEKSVWTISVVNMLFLFVIGVIFYFASTDIVSVITPVEQIRVVGILCLKILSFGYVFYALGMVTLQAFNGAGDTYTPTLLNFICFWLIEIPLAYLIAVQIGMNEEGVFLAIVIAESSLGILGLLAFRRGKWKLREV